MEVEKQLRTVFGNNVYRTDANGLILFKARLRYNLLLTWFVESHRCCSTHSTVVSPTAIWPEKDLSLQNTRPGTSTISGVDTNLAYPQRH